MTDRRRLSQGVLQPKWNHRSGSERGLGRAQRSPKPHPSRKTFVELFRDRLCAHWHSIRTHRYMRGERTLTRFERRELTMNRTASFIKHHSLVVYFVLAYVFSWIMVALISVAFVFGLLALFGPALAAILVSFLRGFFTRRLMSPTRSFSLASK